MTTPAQQAQDAATAFLSDAREAHEARIHDNGPAAHRLYGDALDNLEEALSYAFADLDADDLLQDGEDFSDFALTSDDLQALGIDLYDLLHEATDSAANLVYSGVVREAFYAVDGLQALVDYADECGQDALTHALTEGTGQYPSGADALGIIAVYHAIHSYLVEVVS